MRKIDPILDNFRTIAGAKTDKELCEILGITYSNLDNWKTRDSIPSKRIYEIANKLGLSMNFQHTQHIRDNKNVVINGSQNIKIPKSSINSKLETAAFQEFLDLYKEYGNEKMLENIIQKLRKIKQIAEED